MKRSEKVRIISKITTRDAAGRHFAEIYSAADLEELEDAGLIEINRPIHEATGIQYGQEEWSVKVTDAGEEMVENNQEDWED